MMHGQKNIKLLKRI